MEPRWPLWGSELEPTFCGGRDTGASGGPLGCECGRRSEQGAVLFIVLVFIITVMSLILVSSIRMSSEVDFVEAEMARMRAYAMCVSGNEYLRNRLITGFPGN
ncbi:MAG: hypothetical protein GY765_20790, partial [bacterium]|nr:hypothetical protein [bacterium]